MHWRLIALIFACALLSSCTGYRVTLNDNEVYRPEPLLDPTGIADANLLNCVRQHIEDRDIRRATELDRLVCSSAGIRNLAGIEIFSRLREMNLSGNNLADITPLFRLSNLEYLDIRNNPELDCEQAARLGTLLTRNSHFPEHC